MARKQGTVPPIVVRVSISQKYSGHKKRYSTPYRSPRQRQKYFGRKKGTVPPNAVRVSVSQKYSGRKKGTVPPIAVRVMQRPSLLLLAWGKINSHLNNFVGARKVDTTKARSRTVRAQNMILLVLLRAHTLLVHRLSTSRGTKLRRRY